MARFGRGHIGWVAHDSLLYPELTGAENLDFYARLFGLEDPRARVAEGLERVGMATAAHRPVRTYSRGMKQRLSVARALLNDPAVLILDEPFNGLDRDGRQRVVELLAEARGEGKLVVLSTHVLDLPEGFVDQMIVLRRGRVLFSGRPEGSLSELYESVLDGRVTARRGSASKRRQAGSDNG
jgi:heme exporter protein A